MDFIIFLDKCWERLTSVFDMISLCYDYVLENIESEEIFIGQYIDCNEEAIEGSNPNNEILMQFQDYIKKLFEEEEKRGCEISDFLSDIEEAFQETLYSLADFGEEKTNEITPVYYLLLALDRYVGTMERQKGDTGPLNHQYQENSWVYYKYCSSLIDEASEKLNFGRFIERKSIVHCLENVLLISTSLYNKKNPTKLVTLSKQNGLMTSYIIQTKMLNVVLVPFNGFKMTNIQSKCGSLFEIEYSQEYDEKYSKRAIDLLEQAIEQNANIIVFPEYVCSPGIQKKIGQHLKEIYENNPSILEKLLFVVAGSGWEDGNNIMRVYDKSGEEIGKQYKMTGYHDDQRNSYMEALRNPGRDSLVLDIMGVGRFMFGICRDISDGKDMSKMIDVFHPFGLLIPAWSSSVNRGFYMQLHGLAAKYHLSAVLCNCCEPITLTSEGRRREVFKKEHNMIVTPYKEQTSSFVDGKVQIIEREKDCDLDCSKKTCIFLIRLDYSYQSVKDAQVAKVYPQICRKIG